MRIVIISLLIVLQGIRVSGQETTNPNAVIGFSCYFAGTPTSVVTSFEPIIKSKDFKKLKQHLFKKQLEKKVVAALLIDELLQTEAIKLTAEETRVLRQIKQLNKKVTVCSGCTLQLTVSVEKLFKDEALRNQLNYSFWLKNIQKTP